MTFVVYYTDTYFCSKYPKHFLKIYKHKNLNKMTNMEDVFKDLEKAGKTDVENLIQWMKNSKLIETANDERVRKLFKEAANQQSVELAKFTEIVAKLAQEQSRTIEQVSKQLAAEAPKLIDAAIVGLKAFKEALRDGK